MIRNTSTKKDILTKVNNYLMNSLMTFLERLANSIQPAHLTLALNFLRIGLLFLLTGLLAAEVYSFTQPVKSYAAAVHDTFDSMVISFALTVLVLGLERYLIQFRRSFTAFEGISHRLVIAFNLVMIGITAYKDYAYIASDCLTERRIELLVWLLWATVLMFIILLTDQRTAQYKVILDRLVLASLSCMMINAGIPYKQLVLYSNVLNNRQETVTDMLIGAQTITDDGIHYSRAFHKTYYLDWNSMKPQFRSQEALDQAIDKLDFSHQWLSYTATMGLEQEVIFWVRSGGYEKRR